MYELKGFYEIAHLSNNSVGTVARFGELSSYARTFTKDMRNYSQPATYPSVELVTFKLTDAGGNPTSLTKQMETFLLGVGEWFVAQHKAGLIPEERNRDRLFDAVQVEFPAATWINMGTIRSRDESAKGFPEWIEFQFIEANREFTIKLWFSDPAFREQYDEYTIEIIPPVVDIDLLNQSINQVQPLIGAQTVESVFRKVEELKGGHPETALKTFQLIWNDPTAASVTTVPTHWNLVIYGQAGMDADNIKNAIRDYIAKSSTLTNWAKIYPDLYAESEFIIVPLWDNIAIPETRLDLGLYSSTIQVGQLKNIVKARVPSAFGSSTSINKYIDKYMHVTSVFYRAMMVAMLGNPNNRAQKKEITQLFPDYMSVSTESTDFVRMEQITQEFVLQLGEALEYARTYSISTVLPTGFTSVIKTNRTYIAFQAEGFQFLVLTKMSYKISGDET